MDGSKDSLVLAVVVVVVEEEEDDGLCFAGLGDTEMHFHALMGNFPVDDRAGLSKRQYARFRIPMSMLNIRCLWSSILPRGGVLLPPFLRVKSFFDPLSSSSMRDVRTGFVPLELIPHWMAMRFNWASFNACNEGS